MSTAVPALRRPPSAVRSLRPPKNRFIATAQRADGVRRYSESSCIHSYTADPAFRRPPSARRSLRSKAIFSAIESGRPAVLGILAYRNVRSGVLRSVGPRQRPLAKPYEDPSRSTARRRAPTGAVFDVGAASSPRMRRRSASIPASHGRRRRRVLAAIGWEAAPAADQPFLKHCKSIISTARLAGRGKRLWPQAGWQA
jgi:hypothetical protein